MSSYSGAGRLLILVLATGSVARCSSQSASLPEGPNVIIITLDTLRADHLGCYGYARRTSPRIDELSRRATFYINAVATAPWTVPTHASIFTGKFPFEHGAHTFKVDKPVKNNVNPLPLEAVTIAEALKSEGYVTGALVANNVFLKKSYQLDQGFDTYAVNRVRAPEVDRAAFRWLQENHRRRFFLFLNYMDMHRPYNTHPVRSSHLPPAEQNGRLIDELKKEVMGSDRPIPQDLVDKVIDQYDTAIANVDGAIGALLDRLAEMGLYENTLFVLTSDHGESFGEHRLVEHSKDLYQEELRIPLIVKAPGQKAGAVVDTLVSSVDIPHLVFTCLPSEVQDRHRTEFPYSPGSHSVISEIYYGRLQDLFNVPWAARQNRERTALYEPPLKYIRSSDGRHELYDLEHDPRELRNLFSERADVASAMDARLSKLQAASHRLTPKNDDRPLTEEEIRQLKALGYL